MNNLDLLWVIMAAALVFLMQAGFKCLEVGLVRQHHITAVAMKNVIDWVVSSLIFFFVGFGLMFGSSFEGWFGTNMFFPSTFQVENGNSLGAGFFMFQLAFAGTAVTIVSGAMSERTGFIPYLVTSLVISMVIYPVFGHWAWGNLFYADNSAWLADIGFIDFAGSTVVHSVGAWISLTGLYFLGPRIGRYDEAGRIRPFKSHNLAYAVLGVFLLWVGWWGFNGGSTLALNDQVGKIILNTNLAGAAGGLVAYFHCLLFQKKADIYEKLLGGVLGGLVAITASPHIQTFLTAILIGGLAGIIHNYSYVFVSQKLKIDDAVGAIPVHGFCGAFGTLAVALFAPADLLPNPRWTQLGIQFAGVAAALVWTIGISVVMFLVLKKVVGLRVSPAEEREGIQLFAQQEKIEEEIDEEELRKLMDEIS